MIRSVSTSSPAAGTQVPVTSRIFFKAILVLIERLIRN
jgi:hypothetical protein